MYRLLIALLICISIDVQAKEIVTIDTTSVNNYLKQGENLRVSKPDSAIYFYNRALSLLQNNKPDKKYYYLFALAHSKLASVYSDLHQTDNAWKHNRLGTEAAIKINAKDVLGKLLMNRGALYSFKAQYDSAVYFYKKSLEVARTIKDPRLESKIYVNMGIIHVYRGNMDSAFIYFKQPLYLAQKLNDLELLAAAYNNIGALCSNVGKQDEALENYKKAKEFYGKLNDSINVIITENNIGSILFSKCDYVGALEQYKNVVRLSKKVNDPMQLAKAYHNIGQIYYNIYAYEEATKYYLMSIAINEKNGDKQGVANDYSTLASVQISNKNPLKALEYCRKAFAIYSATGYQAGLSKIYARLGDVYYELNNNDSALHYLSKSKALSTVINDMVSLETVYSTSADIYKKQSDYKNAIVNLNNLIDLTNELGDTETNAIAYSKLAGVYNNLKDFKRAYQYAIKGYNEGVEGNFPGVIAESSKELKEAYAGMGDFKKALYYADIFSQTTDSLFRKTQSEAAIYAEARWEAGKKESQIRFLEEEQALKDELIRTKESENTKQKAVIYLLIGGLVILIASASIIFWFVRKQRRLEFQEQLNKISQLRLENARGRISPHFLFNSLSIIQDELTDKPEVAKRLTAIVNMLRCTLLNIEKPFITLKEELEFVDNYLLLQEAKVGPIKADIKVETSDLYDYQIPAMIVQIPVENSIKHGLSAKSTGDKMLTVDAQISNDHLNISIVDNGIGRNASLKDSKIKGTGTGLKVINQTVHLLNSKNQKKINFTLVDLKDEAGKNLGTEVKISIPKGFNFELN